MEDEDDVQHKGNDHHKTIKDLKLVLKELHAVGIQLSSQLYHEEGEESQAQVVKNLQTFSVSVDNFNMMTVSSLCGII